eukprot:3483303-Pyramimonas_sp.AAC.1
MVAMMMTPMVIMMVMMVIVKNDDAESVSIMQRCWKRRNSSSSHDHARSNHKHALARQRFFSLSFTNMQRNSIQCSIVRAKRKHA